VLFRMEREPILAGGVMKALFSLMLALAVLQGAAAQSGQGTISGRVTRPGGTEGISGVDILLVGPLTGTAANAAASNPLMIAEIAEGASVPQARATTESDGRFVFRNLAPGQYTVRAQREGHFSAAPGATGGLVSMVTSSVTVSAGNALPEIQLTMVRGATISGRVRDANGQSAPNLSVMAYQIQYREGRQVLSATSTRTTDDRGEYRIYWLSPGEYYVAVSSPRSGTATVRTFYPSVTDFKSALPVPVTDGADVAGMDINLRVAPAFKITGSVVSSLPVITNPPRPTSPTFYLLPRDAGIPIEPTFPTFPNYSTVPGEFEIRGVSPGSYDLVATVPDSSGRPSPGKVRVEVGSRDVEGVTVAIHPGVEVKARVFLDGKLIPLSPPPALQIPGPIQLVNPQGGGILPPPPPPPPPPSPPASTFLTAAGTLARVFLRSKEIYPQIFESAASGNMTSDGAGGYVWSGVPEGTYSIQLSGAPANSYVADIREGGASIYDTGFIVGDRPQIVIDVMLASGAKSIRGTVRDAAGKSVASATVVLVPSIARRQNTTLYRTTRTSVSGEFTLNNLAPGDYKLFAWESIPNTAYMNATFMEQYEARGQSVTLGSGSEPMFDLTVIPNHSSR
jgi:sarcosine oxidase gamma subunit